MVGPVLMWPVEAARAMKMWKTKKQVSHIFTARWETRRRKKRAGEFPTAPTRPYYWSIFYCPSGGQKTYNHGVAN